MKYSRLVARVENPSSVIVEDLIQRLRAMQANPVGVDELSQTGYTEVLRLIQTFSTDINNGDPQNNPLWGILAENAKYFTTAEYLQILEMAKSVMLSV